MLALSAGAMVLIAGCGEGSFEKSVVIATGGEADGIVPLLYNRQPGQVYTELMFDKLADIGPGQNTVGDVGYEPRGATSWKWSSDSLQVTFSLDPKGRWHDGQPVRASDFRFAFGIYGDPKVLANGGSDLARNVDSISVADSLTLTVWFKKREPEQFHVIAYNLLPLPEHLLKDVPRDSLRSSAYSRAPVGNGPFKFVSWDKGHRLELAAFDSFARGRPKLDRVIFTIMPDASAGARAVIAGDADFIESAGPDDIAEAAKHAEIRIAPVHGYEYGFVSFNMHTKDGKAPHAILASKEMRRALTMAVDRAALVKNVHDTLGLPGIAPTSRWQWAADTTLQSLPYDVAAAEKALDALGWVKGADGMRSRNGKPLALTMLVAATNRPRVRYGELVQQALAKVGAKVTIDGADFSAFGAKLAGHDWDLALFSWRSSPSPRGIRDTWHSNGFAPGRITNAGGYLNKAFDAQVDSALAARAGAETRAHFRAAYTEAIQDPPAIWLYEPLLVNVTNRRLVTGTPRVDAWWQSVAAWDVTAPAKRSGASQAGTKSTSP